MTGFLALGALIRKEFIQAIRDRRVLGMLLVVPVADVTMFAYAANMEFNHVNVVVVDQDHTQASRALVRRLGADDTLRIRSASSVEAAEAELDEGRATIALVVPKHYQRDSTSKQTANLQVLLDGSDPGRSIPAEAVIEQFTARENRLLSEADGTRVSSIRLEPRLLFNPGLKSRPFMVPATAASTLIILMTVTTAMGLAKERESGTIEQLLVTPITPTTLIIGKTIPYAIFGLFDEAVIFALAHFAFGIPIGGSLLALFVGGIGYLVATLGAGLSIATVSKTQQQALMGGFFLIIPALLLSGFISPVEAMPRFIDFVTRVNPVRNFLEIIRSVLLRSASFLDVLPAILMLWGVALAVLSFAVLRLRADRA